MRTLHPSIGLAGVTLITRCTLLLWTKRVLETLLRSDTGRLPSGDISPWTA
jgi:hypothetical protein